MQVINKWAEIFARWEQFAIQAKEHWSELNEDELLRISGNRSALASLIQTRYYVTKIEAYSQIEIWVDGLDM